MNERPNPSEYILPTVPFKSNPPPPLAQVPPPPPPPAVPPAAENVELYTPELPVVDDEASDVSI
jgi:hypothetical protein